MLNHKLWNRFAVKIFDGTDYLNSVLDFIAQFDYKIVNGWCEDVEDICPHDHFHEFFDDEYLEDNSPYAGLRLAFILADGIDYGGVMVKTSTLKQIYEGEVVPEWVEKLPKGKVLLANEGDGWLISVGYSEFKMPTKTRPNSFVPNTDTGTVDTPDFLSKICSGFIKTHTKLILCMGYLYNKFLKQLYRQAIYPKMTDWADDEFIEGFLSFIDKQKIEGELAQKLEGLVAQNRKFLEVAKERPEFKEFKEIDLEKARAIASKENWAEYLDDLINNL